MTMKKYAYIFAAAVAALACTKENPSVPAEDQKPADNQPLVEMTFGAVLEDNVSPSSKAAISGNKTLWTSEDKISVFDSDGNREFSSTGEGPNVIFSGEAASAETYYALYPYQAGASCTDGVIKATVPSEQTATLGSFDPAAALMVARGSDIFEFKNVCSLIKVTVPSNVTGITSIEFSGNADEDIAGDVNISFNESGLPIVSGAASKTIVLKAAESTLAAGDYYIAALPNTYSQGLKLLIKYDNGMFQQAKATGALTVARSAVRPVGSVKWPEVVFLGADNNPGNDIEVNTAVQWMIYNIKNSAYVPFAALSEAVLSNCKTIWWHYQGKQGIDGVNLDSKEKLVSVVPKCNEEKVVTLLKGKLNSGTGFLLTRFATHYQAVLGVAKDGKGPNNCWGNPEPGNWTIDGIGEIYTAGGNDLTTHPLFTGLTNNEEGNKVKICMVDAGYLLSNSVARYNVHEGWGDYVVKNGDVSVNLDQSYMQISEKVGCNLLAKDGDQDIVIWEFPATENRKGKVLCIGTPFYDWHTTEGTCEWKAGFFHNNVLDMTRNAINYLKPATETSSAE